MITLYPFTAFISQYFYNSLVYFHFSLAYFENNPFWYVSISELAEGAVITYITYICL